MIVMAAAAAAPAVPPPRLAVTTPARASVRIVAAARVHLGESPQPRGHVLKRAVVTVEDGTRRDAKLVEFQ